MDKLQITEAGRKRVASDDFAKCLVHVIQQACEMTPERSFHFVVGYVALNLLVDETNFVAIGPPGTDEATALADFMNANDDEIRAALRRTMSHGDVESAMLMAGFPFAQA